MRDAAIDQLIPDYDHLKNRAVFMWLLILSFLIRFPFIYRDYIDRDESTFILVAQGWLDGHLPYTILWDLKPPVTFLFFAVIIFLFGKSLIAIRIGGIIVVVLIAFFSFKICNEVASKKISFWSGILAIILCSLFGSLQGVMSEHISMLFFMPAIYLIVKYRSSAHWLLAGLLFGAAIMTKINLSIIQFGSDRIVIVQVISQIGVFFFFLLIENIPLLSGHYNFRCDAVHQVTKFIH